MKKIKFYAVAQGRKTGIFNSWEKCKESVEGYSGANFKSFPTRKEAEEYLRDNGCFFNDNPGRKKQKNKKCTV